MQTVDITVKERDLKVVFGEFAKTESPRDGAYQSLKYLYMDVMDIRKYYIRLGFHLDEFERFSYYMDFGFLSLADFCAVNLGMDKSAVSRCIGVYRSFNGSLEKTYKNGLVSSGCAMELADCWKDYSYSQLCEMVSMNEEQREKVKPEMTVKQIRELKKENVSRSKENVSHVATSQQNAFSMSKFCEYKGAVLSNWIKRLDYDDVKHLSLYDQNGKEIHRLLTCDILCIDQNHIVLRVSSPLEEEIIDDES